MTLALRSFTFSVRLRRCGGYNCLIFDSLGQGAPIREQHLPFRYDWEAVVTPAVDYALTRPDVDGENSPLMGMSMGGYLAARAVAFEQRFRAAIFFDGVYDLHETMRGILPKEACGRSGRRRRAQVRAVAASRQHQDRGS